MQNSMHLFLVTTPYGQVYLLLLIPTKDFQIIFIQKMIDNARPPTQLLRSSILVYF